MSGKGPAHLGEGRRGNRGRPQSALLTSAFCPPDLTYYPSFLFGEQVRGKLLEFAAGGGTFLVARPTRLAEARAAERAKPCCLPSCLTRSVKASLP